MQQYLVTLTYRDADHSSDRMADNIRQTLMQDMPYGDETGHLIRMIAVDEVFLDTPNDTVDALVQAESFIDRYLKFVSFEADVADTLAGIRAAIQREQARQSPDVLAALKIGRELAALWGSRPLRSDRVEEVTSQFRAAMNAAIASIEAGAPAKPAAAEDWLRADQALFDAAPDMLSVLQMALPALEWCERQWANSPQHGEGINVLAVARAVIAKAEGRANG